MPLPDLIEIVPLDQPVRAEITVPGSKSITNRALVLAALSAGKVTLEGALWSEDTQVMVDCLERLGFEVRVDADPNEVCNRRIEVHGRGGEIPKSGTAEKPLELFVGNAGTAARFVTALVCLGTGTYRLHGVPRMHERPQAALFRALRELGYQVDSTNDKLPAVIHGTGTRRGRCRVSIEESSQFASALLLCAERGNWMIEVVGENAEESPYVAMTLEMIKIFPRNGGTFEIEPDASSGSYFWAIGLLAPSGPPSVEQADAVISVQHWPASGWQIDERFREYLLPKALISRRTDLGDSIMTSIVIAPFIAWSNPPKYSILFTDLHRLRMQECERVVALRAELTKCGATVIERGDTLEVMDTALHGAEIETYDDHRMAMCFAVVGLKVPGIKLRNPSCVKKTFPNFFQKLAAAPPQGLGATILDGHTGRRLSHDELFAG